MYSLEHRNLATRRPIWGIKRAHRDQTGGDTPTHGEGCISANQEVVRTDRSEALKRPNRSHNQWNQHTSPVHEACFVLRVHLDHEKHVMVHNAWPARPDPFVCSSPLLRCVGTPCDHSTCDRRTCKALPPWHDQCTYGCHLSFPTPRSIRFASGNLHIGFPTTETTGTAA